MNPPMWDFPKHQSWSSHLVQDAQHSSKRHLHGDNRHVYAIAVLIILLALIVVKHECEECGTCL